MTQVQKSPMPTQPMGWDATIENDGRRFALLNPGDYRFRVETVDRKYNESRGCHQADVTLLVVDEEHSRFTTLRDTFLLCKELEWKLSAFFRAIGLKKRGEKCVMDWEAVPGRRGKARIGQDSFTGREGRRIYVNKVKRYHDCDEEVECAGAPAAVAQGQLPEAEELPF